jgi:hypothetical protein
MDVDFASSERSGRFEALKGVGVRGVYPAVVESGVASLSLRVASGGQRALVLDDVTRRRLPAPGPGARRAAGIR